MSTIAAAGLEVPAGEPEGGGSVIRAAAGRYDSSPRTIKRWRAIGREAGDECPLEDPERMLAWWSRNMSQKAPDGINLAVIAARKRKPEPVVKEMVEPEVPVKAEPPPVFDAGDTGLKAELARLELISASLGRRALEPGQAKPYLDSLSRMSALSEKLRVEAERQGELVPRRMVEDCVRGFHAGIEREFRGQFRAMCELLELVPTPQREEEWQELCDRLFERMGEEVLR